MHTSIKLLIGCLLLASSSLSAQHFTVSPAHPAQTEAITLSVDLSDSPWQDEEEELYLLAGAIIDPDGETPDFTLADSCSLDRSLVLRKQGNQYQISFTPSALLNIPDSVQVSRLAFRLLDEDCQGLVHAANGKPFYFSLNLPKPPAYERWSLEEGALRIKCDRGDFYLSPYTGQVLKTSFVPFGESRDQQSWSVIAAPGTQPLQVQEEAKRLLVSMAGELVAVVQKSPLHISYPQAGGLTQLAAYRANLGGFRFEVQPEERFFGTGFRALPQDRRGWRMHTYNAPRYGYDHFAEDLNFSMPVIASSANYLLYLDNAYAGVLDLAQSNPDELSLLAEGGPLSYFVVWGEDYSAIMHDFTALVGRQPMPPRWALGYLLSRFGYENQDQSLDIANRMLEAGYPVDAMIFDLYWYGDVKDICDMEWDTTRFPDPAGMLQELRAAEIMPVLINEPFMTQTNSVFAEADSLGLFAKNAADSTYVIPNFWAGPAGLLDIFEPEVVDWFWSKLQPQMDIGTEGWWSDLGEPEKHPDDLLHKQGPARALHNVYGMEWARMFTDKFEELYPDKRLFNLSRSGYVGFQRYSTFPWSGDVHRNWRALGSQIPIMLGMNMCGIGYMHSDAGGFAMGQKDEELYLRWLQMCTFNPIFRPHSDAKTAETEPIFYSATVQRSVKELAVLRRMLLPYNYSLSFANSQKGELITRPLFYDEGAAAELYAINDAFLWGPNFMIAPILRQGVTERTVHFPEGDWLRLDEIPQGYYAAGSSHMISAPLDKIPVFVKKGSITPMSEPFGQMSEFAAKGKALMWIPDEEATVTAFSLYEDDGKLRNAYARGQYRLYQVTGTHRDDMATLHVDPEGDGYVGMPGQRGLNLTIGGMTTAPKWVKLNGRKVKAEANASAAQWSYNALQQAINITLPNYDWSALKVELKGIAVGYSLREEGTLAQSFVLHEPWSDPGRDVTVTFDIHEAGQYLLRLVDERGDSYTLLDQYFPVGNHGFRHTLFSESGYEGKLVLTAADGRSQEATVTLRHKPKPEPEPEEEQE